MFRSFIARSLIVVTILGGGALAASGVAAADEKEPPPPSGGGCWLVDRDGKPVQRVDEGTVVGLFHCGSDGHWHFGWFTNGAQAGGGTTVSGGSTGPAIGGGLLKGSAIGAGSVKTAG